MLECVFVLFLNKGIQRVNYSHLLECNLLRAFRQMQEEGQQQNGKTRRKTVLCIFPFLIKYLFTQEFYELMDGPAIKTDNLYLF